jgi:hypothetical protein
MKKKLPVYLIGLLLIAIPFKFAYLDPAPSFFADLFCFLSVLTGFLIILIGGSTDGQEVGH